MTAASEAKPGAIPGPNGTPVHVDHRGRLFVHGVEIRARYDPLTGQITFPAKNPDRCPGRIVGATPDELAAACPPAGEEAADAAS